MPHPSSSHLEPMLNLEQANAVHANAVPTNPDHTNPDHTNLDHTNPGANAPGFVVWRGADSAIPTVWQSFLDAASGERAIPMILALVLFVSVLIATALEWTHLCLAALLGAAAMLLLGVLTPLQAAESLRSGSGTIALLFGMMLVVRALEASGAFKSRRLALASGGGRADAGAVRDRKLPAGSAGSSVGRPRWRGGNAVHQPPLVAGAR